MLSLRLFLRRRYTWLLYLFFSPFQLSFSQTQGESINRPIQIKNDDTSKARRLEKLFYKSLYQNPDSALFYSQQAYESAKKIQSKLEEGRAARSIALTYQVWGNYSRSMEYVLKALQIFEALNNQTEIAATQAPLGHIYRYMNDYTQALNVYFKGLDLVEKNKDSSRVVLGVLNSSIGKTYILRKQGDSAIAYLQKAYLYLLPRNHSSLGLTLVELGEAQQLLGNDNLALEYYRLGIKQMLELQTLSQLPEAYLNIARFFNENGQIDSTIFYAGKSFRLAQHEGFLPSVLAASSLLATMYKTRNRLDSSNKYLEITLTSRDTLYNLQKMFEIQSMGFEEKLRQQEIELRKKQAAEERKQNIQYAAIALGTVLFLIIFLMLSHTIIAGEKLIRFLGILALLIVFEFINLILHPYIANLTHDSPFWMLLLLVCIASLLIPAHHKLEKWIRSKLVEKNKMIKLAAAKRTIEALEGRTPPPEP